MRKFLLNADVLIGHNIERFDVPVLERLLDIKITARLVDTLALSWYLEPERARHGLEWWGEEFGVPKPKIESWTDLPLETYIHRCEQDVQINWRLWKKFWRHLTDIYVGADNIWKFLHYLHFKMDCAREQEHSGWKLDVQYARESLAKLELAREEKTVELAKAMPKVAKTVTRTYPARPFKADGSLSATGIKWQELCAKHNLSPDSQEPIEEIVRYDDPNPASTTQIKDWLYSLGWEPATFKHTRDKKTGDIKSTPQINKEKQHGGGVCESVKRLYEKAPGLEYLDGLSILNHRIPILRGFIECADNDQYVKARIQGFTNTLRYKHTEVVNLPKIDQPYGVMVRGSLIAPEGFELCGADMSSLEDRIKQHFVFKYDPDYVHSVNREGYDPHLTIAVMAGMMTQEDMDFYISLDSDTASKDDKARHKKLKSVRSIAKNANYACQYGAGAKRVAITAGITIEDASRLHKAYWEFNWSIRAVSDATLTKYDSHGKMWLFNPISGFWYSLRTEKDKFSTLVQGTAAYCFDLWIGFIRSVRPQLTATFHDEGVWCIKQGFRDQCNELMATAIKQTNDVLKLNRELGIDVQYGNRYSEIH